MTVSKVLAQYQLVRSLGGGWLGEVHAANDLDDGHTYAVRVLADANTAQAHLLLQLAELLRRVMGLPHPHLLPVDTLQERGGQAFYRMGLAERGSLRQLLQFQARSNTPTDLLVALDLLRQSASGLAHAHEHELTHGNLKPENVLLQPGPALLGRGGFSAQLSDFGLAELRTSSYGTSDAPLVSSLTYLSPEQTNGVRGDARSDLYALGVILYELVTGLVPFETRTPAEAFERHNYAAPVQPSLLRPDLPEDVEELILTLLAKRPEDRPASARELEARLQHLVNRMMPSGPEPTVSLPPLALPPHPPTVELPRDASPHPRLLIYGEDRQLARLEVLTKPGFTVGRAPGNDVVLEHAGVSRHHLSVEFQHNRALVTDLNATNTSQMDGVPLPSMTPASWPWGQLLFLRPYWLYLHEPVRVTSQPRVVVSPSVSSLTLTPGQPAALPLTLANTGRTVDHFRLSVDGVPESWLQNAHSEVQLNPGTQGPATLQIVVPRAPESLAGEYSVTVLARSRENPQEFGRAEMTWTVLPFYETAAALTPSLRRTWLRTRYDLTVTNGGNAPLNYTPTVRDDEDAIRLLPRWQEVFAMPTSGNLSNIVNIRAVLSGIWMRLREGLGKVRIERFAPHPETAPGGVLRQVVRVRVPVRLIGSTTHRTLPLVVQADRHDPLPVPARLQHNPLIPLWLLPVLIALLALLGWWVTRPPEITAFDLKGDSPLRGQAFAVDWQTSGARSVRLEAPPGTALEASQQANQQGSAQAGIAQPGTPSVAAASGLAGTPSAAGAAASSAASSGAPSAPADSALARRRVAGNGEVQLPGVSAPVTYTLVARGWLRETRRALTVTPTALAPEIRRFAVSPQSAAAGQTVTVSWDVTNVDTVQLAPFGTVPARGQQTFKLSKDTTVTIQASAGTGSPVTRSADVTVLGPKVVAFALDRQSVTAGQAATLSWDVQNASTVSIEPLGSVPVKGSLPVSPSASTTYTLHAGNGSSDVQATASLAVSARPPAITSFSVSPSSAKAGGSVTVSWSTTAAQTVQLTTASGTQTLPQSGSLPITVPSQSGAFTLIASNTSGQQDTASRLVNVQAPVDLTAAPVAAVPVPVPTPAPTPAATPAAAAPATPATPATPVKVIYFKVDKPVIVGTQVVTVSWEVDGVQTVRISPLDGTLPNNRFPPSGSVQLAISKSRSFTLIVGPDARAATKTEKAIPPPLKVTQKVEFSPAPLAAKPAAPVAAPAQTAPVQAAPAQQAPQKQEPTPAAPVVIPATPQASTAPTRITPMPQASSPSARLAPPTQAASPLDGRWDHTFGSMNLRVRGSRVTGTFNFGDRHNGQIGIINGSVFKSGDSYTVNASVTAPASDLGSISFVVRFAPDLQSFSGPYSERAQRERWCGWRPGTPRPADCQ